MVLCGTHGLSSATMTCVHVWALTKTGAVAAVSIVRDEFRAPVTLCSYCITEHGSNIDNMSSEIDGPTLTCWHCLLAWDAELGLGDLEVRILNAP